MKLKRAKVELRTIFTSSMLSSGMDINSVAYGLNDNPATVLRAYNELQAAYEDLVY